MAPRTADTIGISPPLRPMAKVPDLSSQIAALGAEDPQAQTNAVNALTTADVRVYPQVLQGVHACK